MNNEVKNPLWQDIQAQSSNLEQVIDHLYGHEYVNLQRAASFLKCDQPIVFIGMTSAAYLCHPAEHYLGSQGRLATVMQASDALYSLIPALKNARIVINTRSGETAEIVKLAKLLQQENIPFVTVTNEPDSTAAKAADYVIWTNSRKDDLVSINIITAMMTVTLLLAVEIIGQIDAVRTSANLLPNLIEKTVSNAWMQADNLQKMFLGVSPIYLLHRGGSKGAANCARLVIEEVARRPAVAMESGEFRQGPIEVVESGFGAMIYILPGAAGELNCHLANDIQISGGNVFIIGDTDACKTAKNQQFPIQPEAGIFRPVLEVVPAQILAYKLAQHHGWEPGSVRYISKVITAETGLQKDQTLF